MNSSQDWKSTLVQVAVLALVGAIIAMIRAHLRSKTPPTE